MFVISTSAYYHPHRIRHNYQLIYAGTEPNGKGVNCFVLQSSNEEHLFAFKISIPNNDVQHGSNIWSLVLCDCSYKHEAIPKYIREDMIYKFDIIMVGKWMIKLGYLFIYLSLSLFF